MRHWRDTVNICLLVVVVNRRCELPEGRPKNIVQRSRRVRRTATTAKPRPEVRAVKAPCLDGRAFGRRFGWPRPADSAADSARGTPAESPPFERGFNAINTESNLTRPPVKT